MALQRTDLLREEVARMHLMSSDSAKADFGKHFAFLAAFGTRSSPAGLVMENKKHKHSVLCTIGLRRVPHGDEILALQPAKLLDLQTASLSLHHHVGCTCCFAPTQHACMNYHQRACYCKIT